MLRPVTVNQRVLRAREAKSVAAIPPPAASVPSKKRRRAELDSRTLKDIGVEPGSITWMS